MVQGLTYVETLHFGGNTLSQSGQFINIATSINLGMCLNGIVWQYAMAQIWRPISGTCLLVELVLRSNFMFFSSTLMGSIFYIHYVSNNIKAHLDAYGLDDPH